MLITKSDFMVGLNCPRCFWKAIHQRGIGKSTPGEIFRAMQGRRVGELAKKRFSKSIDLSVFDIESNIRNTEYNLKFGKTIFEAGFRTDTLYARVDVLVPNSDGTWNIIEVKSGSEVKTDYIYDVGFQKYVCENAGIVIKSCSILYVNNTYIKNGDIDVFDFFVEEDITDKVSDIMKDIPWIIDQLVKICNLEEAPQIKIDKYLLKDYPCELDSDCWSFLPTHHVNNLYRLRKSKAVEYFKKGIFKIEEVPDEELNDKHIIQKRAILNNQSFINKDGICSFLKGLEFPIYYLDFETFAEAVPRFDDTKPYRQMPFQFSLHIEDEQSNVKHYEYLHKKNTDPRLEILKEMKSLLGDKGSIIVFNESFEKGRLKELALDYPEYGEWVDAITSRIVDLIKPFTGFDYYNPAQKGSCSIKKVLPSITGKGYAGLEIANGEDAYISYLNATFEDHLSKEERSQIYNNLLAYCCLDTEGMVWIMEELRRIAL